ncbi:MAG: hypothetical protein KJ914_13460 [Gammaproteobacteria bacterium]|nr:hypothetical protein [Gammaproteobacteria bacterium]MBU1723771.1 hypothetical protein [Gammaproteobacteria bacterium]MBU2004841.1 hypothetical protein [Gammaproteobacteria bacterium]
MITTEQQTQVDAAMELLSGHIAKEPWEEWMVEVFTDAIAYAAEMLELSADEVLDYLEEQPLGQMAHAHVFEHFVTTETNEGGESVLKEFMRTRVQEDKASFACQYLHALSESKLALWEVVGVKAGEYANVKRMGSDESAVQVPMEADRIPQNLCIAARLLRLPNGEQTFGFGLLPVERKEAEDILAYLQQVRTEMEETARTEEQEYTAEDVEEAIHEELVDLMFHETFATWIGQGFE